MVESCFLCMNCVYIHTGLNSVQDGKLAQATNQMLVKYEGVGRFSRFNFPPRYSVCLSLQALNANCGLQGLDFPTWSVQHEANQSLPSHMIIHFPSLIRCRDQSMGVYSTWKGKQENRTSIIHAVLRSKERPRDRMGKVKLTTACNPTIQCRGINPDYLTMLFLDLNEKFLGQIRVQRMPKSWCRNDMTAIFQTTIS